jgi:hypothetical protein
MQMDHNVGLFKQFLYILSIIQSEKHPFSFFTLCKSILRRPGEAADKGRKKYYDKMEITQTIKNHKAIVKYKRDTLHINRKEHQINRLQEPSIGAQGGFSYRM